MPALLQVVRSEEGEAGEVALRCLGELGPMALDSPLLQVVLVVEVVVTLQG